MDIDSSMKETTDLRNNVELTRTVSDKHLDLLRPSARSHPLYRGQAIDAADSDKGKYTLIKDPEDFQQGMYGKPLPFRGCGIGWFSFLLGFLCPPMWYYGTILYFGNHYRKDPRERAGLGASAIAALLCSVGLLIIAAILLLNLRSLRFQVQS
ncbi:hypothetical protein L6164_013922 [Bauhinia variegata]|uniref:Uncharacterized protein n=1 Tax=Bauhinia variegata TaxID=167791 RepID=A0ACB9NFW2_BAUVA|nr:hypothetical protein L6164_013922 [Bauhinia variegata]